MLNYNLNHLIKKQKKKQFKLSSLKGNLMINKLPLNETHELLKVVLILGENQNEMLKDNTLKIIQRFSQQFIERLQIE